MPNLERSRWPCALLLAAACAPQLARADDHAADEITIVLIGAARHAALEARVQEFLERSDLRFEIEQSDSLDPRALAVGSDIHVLVTLTASGNARLYMRGPGKPAVARDLELPGGLDEVGCELIANVVESASLALLRDSAVSKRGPPSSTSPPASVAYEIGLRGVGGSSPAPSRWELAAGIELGRSARFAQHYSYRIRAVYEYVAPTTLRGEVVDAKLAPMALRGGLDLGGSFGPHTLVLGAGLGVDLLRITPRRVERGWTLSSASTFVMPVVRLELRYDLALGPLQLGAAVFTDAALLRPRYEARSSTQTLPVAEPSWLRPGIALSVGLRFPIAR